MTYTLIPDDIPLSGLAAVGNSMAIDSLKQTALARQAIKDGSPALACAYYEAALSSATNAAKVRRELEQFAATIAQLHAERAEGLDKVDGAEEQPAAASDKWTGRVAPLDEFEEDMNG